MHRLEDRLPMFQRGVGEPDRPDAERIQLLEIAVQQLKARLVRLESVGVDE